ncbi:AMP-binding protein [Actinokineospora spheciospongiae]|uniref:AMP-binding protein n=1 Tax=Actinokineospora spheciospongiae TaxID=909613 RepID=UPI000D718145|nr:AMP-binding protein [Actinokineospora spheciospongiae]PWW52654.1 acyl-CoA synthetase (AMP-forming)/AMP-acid ligase II [Actinokineospora spheciospongiae]
MPLPPTAAVLGNAVAALASTGLARQARPRHLRASARALRTTGTSAATLLALAAEHRPDAPGLVDDAGSLTFAQLDDLAARLTQGIAERYRPAQGATLAILCRNHRGWVAATVAAARLGANVVYLNTEFSGPQLAGVWERVKPDLLITDAEFLPLVPTGEVPTLVGWHDGEDLPVPTIDELAAEHTPFVPQGKVPAGKVTILTSGTTGTPKGAARKLSPMAVLSPAVTIIRRTGLRSGDPVSVAVPLFHGFGLAIWALALFVRCPVVLRRRFDPEQALADVAAHRVAFVAMVPVMLQRVLALPEPVRRAHDRRSLRTVLSGGSALRPELAERFMAEFGDVLYNGYGSSEIGIAALATPADLRAGAGTVGRPTIGVPVRILDDNRVPVPDGRSGTIFVGGQGHFEGHATGATKEVVDGLMDTGDLGRLDAAGRLYVEGRADDMIVSGGENVYPQEVEDCLARHPSVADVAVLGVDDEEYGQRLVAFVVTRGEQPPAEALTAHVKANLARYKVPREIRFLGELPRTPTGKLLKRELPS